MLARFSSAGHRRMWWLLVTIALSASIPLSRTDQAEAGKKAPAAIRPNGPTAPPPRPQTEEAAPDISPSAEVTFATPQRFVIVSQSQAGPKRLYARNDIIPDSKVPGQGFVVEEIQADGLVARDTRTQKSIRIGVGSAIPGAGGRRVERTVLLDGVEYHYVSAGPTPDPDPRLLGVRDRRAQLGVDVTAPQLASATAPAEPSPIPPPQERPLELPQRLDKSILEKVRVKPTGRDNYEINAADAKMALNHSGKILMEAMAAVRPELSLDQGLNYRVQSAVADGVLGPRGFRVVSPNLAERAGIEAGDVVLSVNGQPINGLADLYRLYQQVKRDQSISVVELNLQRQGQLMTKTYRIR